MNNPVSRRFFLKGAGAAAFATMPAIFGISKAFAQAEGETANDDTATIINIAATAELFATTHYLAAINNAEALELTDAEVGYMQAAFLQEQDHYELLVSLGAVPVVTQFYVPETLFSDRALFTETTEVAETVFVAAYLAATRIFAEGAAAPLAVTTAQIAAIEAGHRAFVRGMGMKLSNDVSYAGYLFDNVSEAPALLQPFLDGSGEGFVGPIAPPTEDEIASIRSEADAIGFTNEGVPFAAITEMPA